MSQDFRFRPDSSPPSWDDKALDATSSASAGRTPNGEANQDPVRNLSQIAQALAARGGGALSVSLALDLILNDLVEQAREATGANGAAIALIRDGNLVCRATAGDQAPDLGVRVETASGLAGACLNTARMQECRDTEADSRVNAEACRRLGVRSMLIAPLLDGEQVFGILQVFSAWPNAFGEREGRRLESFARAIAQNKREAERGAAAPRTEIDPQPAALSASPATTYMPNLQNPAPEDVSQNPAAPLALEPEPDRARPNELWTSLLIVLVIATAVLLGIAIGWHSAAKEGPSPGPRIAPPPSTVSASSRPGPQGAPPAAAATGTSQPGSDGSRESLPSAAENIALPASPSLANGGLLVTQDGKVIYRSQPDGSAGPAAAPANSGARLIHRVAPDYPAEAKEQNIEGTVVLVVEIQSDGTVGEIGVAAGDPLLAKAAVKAVRQWRYEPFTSHGQPAERQTRISIKFTLTPG
jgi:TonB family protein